MHAGLDAGPILKMCGDGSVPGPDFGENLTFLVPTPPLFSGSNVDPHGLPLLVSLYILIFGIGTYVTEGFLKSLRGDFLVGRYYVIFHWICARAGCDFVRHFFSKPIPHQPLLLSFRALIPNLI